MVSVRNAVVDLLRSHGMTTMFGNPGSTELSFLDRFPDDFRYVLALQEAVAVGLADGHAQATGTTALVNLHTAPGVGNAMGAILNAAANRTPMVVTAGQQVRAMMTLEALLTNVDATMLPRPAVKWAFEPPRPQDVPAAFARAVHLAQSPPTGPVFLSLPMDDFGFELDDAEAAAATAVAGRKVNHRNGPDPAAISALADRLGRAKSPALVVGGDIDASGAWDEVVALAERWALPVWGAPAEGRSGFPEDHPSFQGFLAPAIALVAQALAGHDLVVVAGAPVFRYYPYIPGPYLPEGTELVHLTRDPGEAAKAPVGEAIVGDLRLAVQALLAEPAPTAARTPPKSRPAPQAPEDSKPMSPAAVFAVLARTLPADTLWVNESPSNIQAFQDQIRVGRPGSFMFSAGGGLGFGLPAAVGAQLGEPSRRVVAVMGDGSMQYAIPALWTAATYRVPLTIVVLTNHEYAILKWFGQLEHVSGIPGLDIQGIDIAAIAAGYGIETYRAGTPDELADAVRSGGPAGAGGPVLIEVPIVTAPPTV